MKNNKLKPVSLKWAQEYMKKIGAKPVTEEDKKRDPSLRKALAWPRT